MLYALPHLAPLGKASHVDVGHVATADAFGHTITATARPIGPCILFPQVIPFPSATRREFQSIPGPLVSSTS
jgi:hypothetical protein